MRQCLRSLLHQRRWCCCWTWHSPDCTTASVDSGVALQIPGTWDWKKEETAQFLRWPNTTYLREGQLFWNQIFSCSTAFDCWDILDAEKGMLEVYQKRTFIEIDTNIRKFSAIVLNMVFKENAYYQENEQTFSLHITLNRCWNLKDFRDQVSDKLAPHNLYSKRWLKMWPEYFVHAFSHNYYKKD